jgi:hypothetical protein
VNPRPANPASTPPSRRQAVTGTFDQKAALELGERAREMEDQAPLRRRRVQGWFGHRDEIDSEGGEFIKDQDHIPQRSEEPVRSIHNQDSKPPTACLSHQSIEFRSSGPRAANATIDEGIDALPAAPLDQMCCCIRLEAWVLITA